MLRVVLTKRLNETLKKLIASGKPHVELSAVYLAAISVIGTLKHIKRHAIEVQRPGYELNPTSHTLMAAGFGNSSTLLSKYCKIEFPEIRQRLALVHPGLVSMGRRASASWTNFLLEVCESVNEHFMPLFEAVLNTDEHWRGTLDEAILHEWPKTVGEEMTECLKDVDLDNLGYLILKETFRARAIDWKSQDVLEVSESASALTPTEDLLLSLIKSTGHRMTTEEIFRVLPKRGKKRKPPGDSTVRGALANLVRQNYLTNNSRAKPRGYGLPDWP